MKRSLILLVFISFTFTLSAFSITSEESQKYTAQKFKEGIDHSEKMHLEKDRIVREANLKRKVREKKSGTNYKDQKIYEQDNENNN